MFKRTALSAVVAVAVLGALSGTATAQEYTTGSAFIDDTRISGGFYLFARKRDRFDTTAGVREYRDNLDHITAMTNIDISSGYFNDMIGVDFAAFAATDLRQEAAVDHEFSFVPWENPYDPDWKGDAYSGSSIYKAAVKLKKDQFWGRFGYIQPTGPSGLGTNWNFLPGTYRGGQIGANFDKLSVAYMWTDAYKAPWFKSVYKFENNQKEKLSYVHSLGAVYKFDNGLSVDGAFTQSKDYLDLYHLKLKKNFEVADGNLYLSYQYYGADDTRNLSDDKMVYDGRAWTQALISSYNKGAYTFKAEATAVKAEGNQGYFLYRPTTASGSSQGTLEVWWDSRSDWNHDGEKAVFFGVWRDFADLGMPGWNAGISYAYGWDGKPYAGHADQTIELKEEAYNFDVGYTFQEGNLKGSAVKLHLTKYNNMSGQDSWTGFKNAFQDEYDAKLSVVVPFSF